MATGGPEEPPLLALDDIRAAAGRLKGVAHHTPVLRSRTLDSLVMATVYLKAENLQRGGAFKIRGAFNRLSTLPAGVNGVAAYSSGNHAQAVAIAAGMRGVPAVVVMPEDAPRGKLEATRQYGAEVVLYDRYSEDRREVGRRVAGERGFALVPPYDDLVVMAGQGTVALELVEEVKHLDYLIVPVGGGGLMAGSATAAKALLPAVRMIGVEPEHGDDTARSLRLGHRVKLPAVPATIADGLMAQTPGELTFQINRRLVDQIVTVSELAIVRAMAFLFARVKTVVEPSGAVGVAALMEGAVDLRGHAVGVILSGGNVAPDRFGRLMLDTGVELRPDRAGFRRRFTG